MTTPPGPPPPPYGPPPYGPPPGQPYPPPPPQPYTSPGGPSYPPGYPPPQRTNWWAVVSLVFGVLGGVLVSVVCGIVGLNKAKQGQGGRGMAIAGLVLSGLWVLLLVVGALLYVVLGKGTVSADSVDVGDCLVEIPDGERVLTVRTVDCAEDHAGEVFATLTMPDGEFPGQTTLDQFSDDCGPALAAYSPSALTDPEVGMYVLYPTQETWEQGDRMVTCIATVDPPRTGSLKS